MYSQGPGVTSPVIFLSYMPLVVPGCEGSRDILWVCMSPKDS